MYLCLFETGRCELTAGLNKPPEMRKKTQTLTISENPNTSEM
jgi:hypothetical protein